MLNNEIEVINNTKEEIKDLIEEFVQKKNKIWNNKNDENELQLKANNFFEQNNFKKLNYIKIGYNFLKQNINLFE